jgi:hypothetical protein
MHPLRPAVAWSVRARVKRFSLRRMYQKVNPRISLLALLRHTIATGQGLTMEVFTPCATLSALLPRRLKWPQ